MKKNHSYAWLVPKPLALKYLIAMKLLLFFILGMSLQTMALDSFSQEKFSLDLKNSSLLKACQAIENKSSYRFVYGEAIVAHTEKVSITAKDATLEEVMRKLLNGTDFTYRIVSNNLVSIIASGNIAFAPIKGKVTDTSGVGIPGVTVSVKGGKVTTQTDGQGNFNIEAKDTDVLVFSIIGFTSVERAVGSQNNINVTLNASSTNLNEVVVTALGVERASKSLSYNVQQIKGDDLTTVKQSNFINSLSGRAAGVTISSNASGLGGSAKVSMRGSRSVNGNNQPLYVIDGVPMLNAIGGQPVNVYGGASTDGGDGISNLNPEDIASMSILEGASASALYGSQAQNGVILITTKKGKVGKAEISVNSSYQASQTAYRPEFQNTYGVSAGAFSKDVKSFGPAGITAYDNLAKYFQTGNNFNNAINFSAGNDIAQTYLSYSNTSATGITPKNKLNRHNFNLRETANFFDKKLTIDGSLTYISQNIDNKPLLGVFPSPLLSLYLFPRGLDIQQYKDNYYDTNAIGYDRQVWPLKNGDFHQENPWWTINNEPNSTKRNRYLLTGNVKYTFTDWLNLQVRGNIDRTTDDSETRRYQGTDGALDGGGKGTYSVGSATLIQKYADVIANFKIPLKSEDFKVGGLIGASITDNSSNNIGVSGGLFTPDYFITANILAQAEKPVPAGATTSAPVLNTNGAVNFNHSQTQAAFVNLDLAYKDWAFLTGSFRQDWSSALAFTNADYYNYPSVGLSLIISQMAKLPDFISFAKVRGSYTEVGNTLPAYLTKSLNSQNGTGALQFNLAEAERTLQPERTKTFETGAELRLLKDRLNLSFTYYKTNTINQFFPIVPTPSTLITTLYFNAGKIQNSGYQFIVGYNAVKTNDFSWNTSINGSSNKNKILEVRDPLDETNFFLTTATYGYSSVVRKGGSYGDIWAQTFDYDDQGRMKLLGAGTPASPYRPAPSPIKYVGNPNPKFQAGWSNTFNYKNFALSLLIDGKFGGKVMSLTQSYMDLQGVSKDSGIARDNGGIPVNGVSSTGLAVTSLDAQTYYNTVGARGAMAGVYMYDATVVRMREVALGYNLPVKNNAIKAVRLSLTGRNLFYFYKKAPYDPELTMSTGNGLAGVDAFNLPATRDIGVNLNLTF